MPPACNSTATAPLAHTTSLLPLRLQLSSILASLTILLPLAFGCASPGPPRPPSLKLPQPATDLTAQRVGDQVILRWTTSAKTSDNLPIKGDLTARVCRNAPPLNPPKPCTAVLTLPTRPGPATATDSLPPSLTADPATLLDYRVEIDNSNGHSAGPSNSAFAAAGLAPPPVASLHATPAASGIILEWLPRTSATLTSVELDRVDLTLAAARQLQTETKSNNAQPLQVAGKESPEIHLRAVSIQTTTSNQQNTTSNQPSATGNEPAGTIDQTTHFGDIYRYTAQRIRTLQLSGHALQISSPATTPVTVTFHDTFPPATPTGLEAVPGQTTVSTNTLSIDLSWQPNTEQDLAGYIVYRRQLPATTPTRLTPAALTGPAYRDLTALPGQPYAYTVTAIDTSGNESPPTPEIQQTLP